MLVPKMLVQIQNYDWCFLPPGRKAFLYRGMNTRAVARTSFILDSGSSVKKIRMTWKVGEKFFPLQPSLKSFCGKHNCVLNAKIHTYLKILIFKECCHGNPYLLSFPTLHMWGTFSSSFFFSLHVVVPLPRLLPPKTWHWILRDVKHAFCLVEK